MRVYVTCVCMRMGGQRLITLPKRDPDQVFGVVLGASKRGPKDILLDPPSANYLQNHKLSAAATLPTN